MLKVKIQTETLPKIPPQQMDILELRYREIFDRTYHLLISLEAAFDAATFIGMKIGPIGKDIKDDLKRNKMEQVTVNGVLPNLFHEETRLKVRKILDKDPVLKGRLLHMPDKIMTDEEWKLATI